ncbi:hypothetical protein [Leptospira meyeri]|uniref:hypothetical protein n=1 Tax=Leptospira meyeri TaxID=29508 RepID=UPI0014383C10|nr:hypothetical protein [Leptospira meyeri]
MISIIKRPVHGQGGFQSLIRKLQRNLNGDFLEVENRDLERINRYATCYGQGGFEERLFNLILPSNNEVSKD